jgi:rhodanese-related sulfurtransferase
MMVQRKLLPSKVLTGMLLSSVLGLLAACQPVVIPSVVSVAQPAALHAGPAIETVAVSIYQTTLQEENPATAQVSTEELQAILADGVTFVFDSRPHLEYSISHIPGSLNVAPKPGVELSHYVSDVAEIERVLTENGVQGKDAALVLYCNGPFCGVSKRLSGELLEADFTNVRRYQLGIPTWRALVGLTQIELDGARYVFAGDKTAVWVDARSAEQFAAGSLEGAVNLFDKEAVTKAKDDKRLPMQDHNTRIIVFGADGEQVRSVAGEIAKSAFHNVSFFGGTMEELIQGIQQ